MSDKISSPPSLIAIPIHTMQTQIKQLKPESFIQPAPNPYPPTTQFPHPSFPSNHSLPNSSQMPEGEVKDGVAARKMQKADREKLRRDGLNEHFMELGNVLDIILI